LQWPLRHKREAINGFYNDTVVLVESTPSSAPYRNQVFMTCTVTAFICSMSARSAPAPEVLSNPRQDCRIHAPADGRSERWRRRGAVNRRPAQSNSSSSSARQHEFLLYGDEQLINW
jgi:hypothetical protein